MTRQARRAAVLGGNRIPCRARLLTRRRERGWDLALESADGARRHLELAVEC